MHTLIKVHVTVAYFCLQLVPWRLVDVSVPYFLIVVQFLLCHEDALQLVWGSSSRFKQLERGMSETHLPAWRNSTDTWLVLMVRFCLAIQQVSMTYLIQSIGTVHNQEWPLLIWETKVLLHVLPHSAQLGDTIVPNWELLGDDRAMDVFLSFRLGQECYAECPKVGPQ